MDIATHSLSQAKIPACSRSPSPPFFHSKVSLLPHNSISWRSPKVLYTKLNGVRIKVSRQRSLRALHASSENESISSDSGVEDRWLLVPVGDGDSRHIGYKVDMPGTFEIASSAVNVGRLPEKADMVIPVATVSGLHARIQKKEGSLLVTDLDSTNGTFINDKRLSPGVVATVSSGSCITFGDIHLAMFRVSKLESMEATSKEEEEYDAVQTTGSPTESNQSTS